MAINFASARPGIDLFNANVARDDAQRRQEEHDFMLRRQYEQAQGADKGMRNAIAAYYAQKQPAAVAPVPTTAFHPTPAMVPNPAATTPVVSPDQSMNPADNPDYGGPTSSAPMPNAVPRAGVDVPATVAAPPMPAAAAAPAAAQPAPGARQGGGFGTMMGELAKQPGTGASMMSLFGTDLASQRSAGVERAKLHQEGLKLFMDASKNDDVASMRAIAAKYDFGIPPEVLNNRAVMAKIASMAKVAKTIGITDDERALGFAKGYMHAEAAGADPNTSFQAAIAEAQKTQPTFKAVHWDQTPEGEVTGFDAQGNAKATGVKGKQQKWQVFGPGGAGERPTATVQNRDDMAKRLKVAYPGLDDGVVQRLVVNPRAQITAQDIMRTEASMRKLTNMGRPLYKTDAEAHTAAVAAVRAAQRDAGVLVGGEGAPGATAPGPADSGPAGRVPPPVRMRFDSSGNEISQ